MGGHALCQTCDQHNTNTIAFTFNFGNEILVLHLSIALWSGQGTRTSSTALVLAARTWLVQKMLKFQFSEETEMARI